jgi:glycosyltransferase involved in cell wall biosynthesis
LRALDVVVHASTSPEPFGLVIAEAMACERPVIVSVAGGAAEIVTLGVDALGHHPGDAEGLAARMTELAIDPALRRRLGSAAGRQPSVASIRPDWRKSWSRFISPS